MAALLLIVFGCTEVIDHSAPTDGGTDTSADAPSDSGIDSEIPDIETNCTVTADSPALIDVGQVCGVDGEVTRSQGLTVRGKLVMREGDALVFTDGASISVEGAGVLDLRAPVRAAWSDEGWDSAWIATDSVAVAPFNVSSCNVFSEHAMTDEVPSGEGLGTAELIHLERGIRIEGASSINIASSAKQLMTSVVLQGGGSETLPALEITGCRAECGTSLLDTILVAQSAGVGLRLDDTEGLTLRDLVIYGAKGVGL